MYESGFVDGDPGIQGIFQLLFLGVSLAGEANSLVPLADLSSRFFPLPNFDPDLTSKNPAFASPSRSAGYIAFKGEMRTESWSSSSLHISPNLEARVKVDRVEVRDTATTV